VVIRLRRRTSGRVGNAAAAQLQLDVYERIADAMFQLACMACRGLSAGRRLAAALFSIILKSFGASRMEELGGARSPTTLHDSKVMGVGRIRSSRQVCRTTRCPMGRSSAGENSGRHS